MSNDADDIAPALGSRGGPASWVPAEPGAPVALARPGFGDAQWSYLYKSRDTDYGGAEPAPGEVAAANRRMRAAPVTDIHGPFIHAPVWGWEVAIYFWLGGMASGSAFVALGCDAAGDHRSAAIARKVALGAVAPAPILLIADLGRPERFLNMMRIFKPRSPMNTGAWCLIAFSGSGGLAVAADLLGRPKAGRALGGDDVSAWDLPRVLYRRAARLHRGPGVVAQPHDPRARIPRDRDRDRRGRHAPRARGERPAARPSHAEDARRDRDRLDADRAGAVGGRRAPPRSLGRGAAARAPRRLLPDRQEPRSRSVSRSGWSRAGPARASTISRASCTSRRVCCSDSRGFTRARRQGRTTPRSPRWPATEARRKTATGSYGRSAPCQPSAPRWRCPAPSGERTAKRSGAPASRSSGGFRPGATYRDALDGGQPLGEGVGRKRLGVRRAVGFEQLSLGERAAVDRVESEPVDQMHHGAHREPVVADRGHRDAVGRARRAWVLVELVVPELIEALDDPGARGSVLARRRSSRRLPPRARDPRRRCRASSSSRRRGSCRRKDRSGADGTGGWVRRERSHRRSRRPPLRSTRRRRGRARRPRARSVRPGRSSPRPPRSPRPARRVPAPSQACRPRRFRLALLLLRRRERRLRPGRSSARPDPRSPRLIPESSRYLALAAGAWVERTGLATSPGAAEPAGASCSPGSASSSSRTRGKTSRPSSSIDPRRCSAGTWPSA